MYKHQNQQLLNLSLESQSRKWDVEKVLMLLLPNASMSLGWIGLR
jgi:hypothetical protein